MAKKTRKKSKTKKNPKVKPLVNRSIGVLHTGTKIIFEGLVERMRKSAEQWLRTHGHPLDTVSIDSGGHYAEDNIGVLESHADLLVNNTGVPVIVAAGGPQSALAAMEATMEAVDQTREDTPVVFTTVADPVGLGLVDDLLVPGANLTGMAGQTSENDPKRLRILKAFASPSRPQEKRVGVLINRRRQGFQKHLLDLKIEANKPGVKLKLKVRRAKDLIGIQNAFAEFKNKGYLGVVVTADAFFNNIRKQIIKEAELRLIPTIYQWRSFVDEGGLISYGPSIEEAYEKAGEYVGRILLGEKPAGMACSTPASPTLFVKKSTAMSLGLWPVPATLDGEQVNVIP